MERPTRTRRIDPDASDRRPSPDLTDLPYWLLHEIITLLPHCITYHDFCITLRTCFFHTECFFGDDSSRRRPLSAETTRLVVDFCPLCHHRERDSRSNTANGVPARVRPPWPRLPWTRPTDVPPRAYLQAIYGYFGRDITRRMFLIVTHFEIFDSDSILFLRYLPAGRRHALSTLRLCQTMDYTRQDVQDFYYWMWPGGDESEPSFDDQMAEIDALSDGGHFRSRSFNGERMPARISLLRAKKLELLIGEDDGESNDGTLLRLFSEWARRCEWSDLETIIVVAGCIVNEDNFGSAYRRERPDDFHDSLRAFCGIFSESLRSLRIAQFDSCEGQRTKLDLTPFRHLEKFDSYVVECDLTRVFPLSLREITLTKISSALFRRLALVTGLRVLHFELPGPIDDPGAGLNASLLRALEQMRNLHTVDAELPFPLEEWSAAGVSFPSLKRCLRYEGAYFDPESPVPEDEVVAHLLALESVFPNIEDLELTIFRGEFPVTFFSALSGLRNLRKLSIPNEPIRLASLVAVLVGTIEGVESVPLRHLDCSLLVTDDNVAAAARIFRSLRLHPAVGVEICRFRITDSLRGLARRTRLPLRSSVDLVTSIMSIPSIRSLETSLYGFPSPPLLREMEGLLFRRPEVISFFSRTDVELVVDGHVYGLQLSDEWQEGHTDLRRLIQEPVM